MPQLFRDDLKRLSHEKIPSPAEQLETLIVWIGDNQASRSNGARVKRPAIAALIGAIKTRKDAEDDLDWLLQQTLPERLYTKTEEGHEELQFWLTIKGWERHDQARKKQADSQLAFMAMQFGDDELTKVVDEYFRPAVQQAGFVLRVLTDNQGAGLIDNQIRSAVRAAALVIADLTHDNNGAYFEAGFAEGIGLPVIYTCRADKFKNKKTHFDTNHMVTIPWDPADLGSASKALKTTIRATLPTRAKMTD